MYAFIPSIVIPSCLSCILPSVACLVTRIAFHCLTAVVTDEVYMKFTMKWQAQSFSTASLGQQFALQWNVACFFFLDRS